MRNIMRNVTFLAIFCVALVTVLAIPAPSLTSSVITVSKNGISREGAIAGEVRMVRSGMALKKFSLQKYAPLDFFSDLISAILGVEVGELLTTINNTLKNLTNLIVLGVTQLKEIMNSVDPNVKLEIQELINVALADAITIITPIMEDLGLVLPQITKKASARTTKDASDIISALLGITLEQFLNKVADTLEQSDALLTSTMSKLNIIADKVASGNPSAASGMHRTSEDCLNKGKAAIRPILDSLYQVLVFKNKMTPKGQRSTLIENPDGLFAEVISTVLGFDVGEAGIQLETTLNDLEEILESYVVKIKAILADSDETREEVAILINNYSREIRNTLRPVKNVLLQFIPGNIDGKDVAGGIVQSILGVSLEDFLNYVDFASQRLEKIMMETVNDTQILANDTGLLNYLAVVRLNDKSTKAAEKAVEPLLTIISHILPGDRMWVTPEEFLTHILSPKKPGNPKKKIFCDFSLIQGHNTNVIVDIISSILGFNLVDTVVDLEVALEELDQLLLSSMLDLNGILAASNDPKYQTLVNGILQKAINDSQVTVWPILDILTEFIPTDGRLHKDIMNGIVETISGVSSNEFINYMEFAAGRFENIIKKAVLEVNHAMNGAEVDIISAVNRLLDATINSATTIIQPFQEILDSILPDLGTPIKFMLQPNRKHLN